MLTRIELVHALPATARRGYDRREAASYVGVSPPTFDKLVSQGSMPRPISIGKRRIWDRVALDRALDLLSGVQTDDHAQRIVDSPLDEWRRRNAH